MIDFANLVPSMIFAPSALDAAVAIVRRWDRDKMVREVMRMLDLLYTLLSEARVVCASFEEPDWRLGQG